MPVIRRTADVVLHDDGRTVTVVPGPPSPERGPTGTPMVTLLGAPQSASLNVGVRWWPAEAELHRLLAELARTREVPAAHFRLAADALADVSVVLTLGERELVTGTSSGTTPYTTVLSVQLAGADVEAVRQAVFGRAGVLAVRVRGTSSAAGCISGYADVSEWTKAAPHTHVVMLAPNT